LEGPFNTVSQVAFTPLSDHLLFGSNKGEFGVSLVENGNSMVLCNFKEQIKDIKVPQDGVISAILSQQNVSIYDLVKQSMFYNFPEESNGVVVPFNGNCMDFGNKAGRLMVGNGQGEVSLLDLRQKGLASTIKASEGSVEKLSVHPFNDLLIVGDSLGCLKVRAI
jgi:WD40 repeat protein